MQIMVEKVEVYTRIGATVGPEGPRHVRYIRLTGKLSTNFFPFVVLINHYPPEALAEYPDLPEQHYAESVTRPFSASFKVNLFVSDILTYFYPYPYGKVGIPIDREGIHKIVLQGSWTPVLCIPVTKPLEIEVDTWERNDFDEYVTF